MTRSILLMRIIGKGDLLACLIVLQLIDDVFCVDDRNNRVKIGCCPQCFVEDERLNNRRRIGKSRCLNQDVADWAAAAENIPNRAGKGAADSAADTTVVEL